MILLFLRKYFIVAVAWALAVLVLSTIPMKFLPEEPVTNLDKAVHFTMYFILAISLFWSSIFYDWKQTALKVFLLAVGYGLLMECIQLATNAYLHRYFEWWDVVANSTGALAAVLLVQFLWKQKNVFSIKNN